MFRRKICYSLVVGLWLVLGLICVVHAQKQEVETLELGEAIRIALENNYDIRIVRNESEIASNNQSLGNAGFFPTLSASASQMRGIEDSRTVFSGNSIPDRDITGARSANTSADLLLNWTLFDGLRMFTTYDRLEELNTLGRQQARFQVEQSVAEIISVYYDIIRQKKTYTVLENTMEVSRERIRIAETKKDLGSGSEYDLLQARADLNADQAALISQEVQLQNTKVLLNELLGREVRKEFEVTDEIPLKEQLVYTDLIQRAVSNNLDLAIARTSQKISELDLKEIQGERLPELELNMGYGYSKNESGAGFVEFSESNGLNYGLTARLGILDGFNINRRAQNAKIRIKSQQLAVEQQRQQLEANVANVYQSYAVALRLVKLESENLTYADQTQDIALERFRLGTINSIELREAQRTLISAENRLIQARYEAKVAETELLRISGMLTQTDK